LTPRAREEILSILLNGLKRLEYRGYDSAGQPIIVFLWFAAHYYIVNVIRMLLTQMQLF